MCNVQIVSNKTLSHKTLISDFEVKLKSHWSIFGTGTLLWSIFNASIFNVYYQTDVLLNKERGMIPEVKSRRALSNKDLNELRKSLRFCVFMMKLDNFLILKLPS